MFADKGAMRMKQLMSLLSLLEKMPDGEEPKAELPKEESPKGADIEVLAIEGEPVDSLPEKGEESEEYCDGCDRDKSKCVCKEEIEYE